MGTINPMLPRGPANKVTGSVKAKKGTSPGEVTAAKVGQIMLPVIDQETGLRGRQIALLNDTSQLSRKIKNDWNVLAPGELAEKIIELENKVSLFEETTPEIEKIKKQAEHLHFMFVFPVALEMDAAPSEKSMPVSFARRIYQAANQVFKTHSMQAFKGLNRIQKQEVLRYAGGNS